MTLIDTHAHLNFPEFTDQLEQVIDRAKEHGVTAIVMPGCDLKSSREAVRFANQYPGYLFAGVGLHPTAIAPQRGIANSKSLPADATHQALQAGQAPNSKHAEEIEFEEFDFDTYLALARQPGVVAIGEVGLDSYRIGNQKPKIKSQNFNSKLKNDDPLRNQVDVLVGFIRIASEVHKPMIIHCRAGKKPGDTLAGEDPHERLLDMLTHTSPRPSFVIHCFQGTLDQAERYLALGGYISLTGTITYSDAPVVTDMVRGVPLERLMLETDSPFLSPVPHRGELNEPWKVTAVAVRVAQLKAIDLEIVADLTTQTARQFFHLP